MCGSCCQDRCWALEDDGEFCDQEARLCEECYHCEGHCDCTAETKVSSNQDEGPEGPAPRVTTHDGGSWADLCAPDCRHLECILPRKTVGEMRRGTLTSARVGRRPTSRTRHNSPLRVLSNPAYRPVKCDWSIVNRELRMLLGPVRGWVLVKRVSDILHCRMSDWKMVVAPRHEALIEMAAIGVLGRLASEGRVELVGVDATSKSRPWRPTALGRSVEFPTIQVDRTFPICSHLARSLRDRKRVRGCWVGPSRVGHSRREGWRKLNALARSNYPEARCYIVPRVARSSRSVLLWMKGRGYSELRSDRTEVGGSRKKGIDGQLTTYVSLTSLDVQGWSYKCHRDIWIYKTCVTDGASQEFTGDEAGSGEVGPVIEGVTPGVYALASPARLANGADSDRQVTVCSYEPTVG